MSAQKEVNSIVTLGWIVLLVMFFVAVAIFGPVIWYKITKRTDRWFVHRNDSKVFKAAEEARRDFD